MREIKLEIQKLSPTSKTSLLNLMILRAWRERWSDSQWSINIKNVLPRGVSGDVYNLADCILHQALVGSTANPLVLNYLKHSICAHLVSHAAVLRRISKFEHLDRVFCLTALLEFLDSVIDSVTCRNKSEEHLLPGALVSLLNWILQIILAIMKRYEMQNSMNCDDSYLLDCACRLVEKIADNQFILGILYVGSQEDTDSYARIREAYSSIKTSLINTNFILKNPVTEKQLHQLAYVDINHLYMLPLSDGPDTTESITYCIQPLLTVNLLANPCNETSFYVSKLLMIQRLKHLTTTRLFYELIRAGFISLSNVEETSHDTLWGAFTFFKVPLIIKHLHSMNQGLAPGGEQQQQQQQQPLALDFIPEVVEALDLLLQDNLLLDFMDTKCSCNIVEFLLDDWTKQHLVTEAHAKHFAGQRENTSLLIQKRESSNQAPSIINFIIRAEVPLSGILKSLCTDYNKVQEAVLGVLTQVLVGNSFDLILSVATVEGRLKTFVSRLIQCNENSKQVPGEVGKPSVIRSTLFDISFLMLTFIVQTYGSEAVLSENGDSFFEKWVRECMVERNKPKNVRNMVTLCDENIVDEMLLSLSKPEAQLKNSNITWQDMCMNLPGVLHHVLIAWEKEALTSADVKSILDHLKRRLTCFSVCATSYLCAHMHAVRETEFLKPLNMIQQFLTPPTSDEMSTQENAKECLGLAFQIIRKMQHDAHATTGNSKTRNVKLSQSIVLNAPLLETFKDVWKSIMELGWLPARVAQILETILNVGGAEWLTKQLVDEILKCKYTREMLKTMDTVFAVLHMDIEATTEALLKYIVPNLLHNRQGDEISEPQSFVLARLCVFCLISCLDRQSLMVSSNSSSSAASSANILQKKRSRSQDDELDSSSKQSKSRKLNADAQESHSNDFTTETSSITAIATATSTTTTTVTPSPSSSVSASSSSVSAAITPTIVNTNNGNGANSSNANGIKSEDTETASTTMPMPATMINHHQHQTSSSTFDIEEPFDVTIQGLFKVFHQFVSTENLSPKSYFVYQFVSLLVEYGKERVRPILKLLPSSLMQNILKVITTDEISVGLISRIYDLNTHNGRQAAISDLCLWRNIQLKKEYIQL